MRTSCFCWETYAVKAITYASVIYCDVWGITFCAGWWTCALLAISSTSSNSDKSLPHTPISFEEGRCGIKSNLWLLKSNSKLSHGRIMLSPCINNSQVIKICRISTKIRISLRIVEGFTPNNRRWGHSIRIIIFLGSHLEQHCIVFPLIDNNKLKHDINPLMLRQVIYCFENFCVVVEQILTSKPQKFLHTQAGVIVWWGIFMSNVRLMTVYLQYQRSYPHSIVV